MQVQISVAVDSTNVAAIVAALATAGGTTIAPKKRGRPSKAEVEAREAADTDEDAEDETEEDEADVEEKPAKTAKALKPESIVKAFQGYAQRHSREKAKKILTKYGAKNVAALPKAKWPEILKLLAK